MKLNYVVLERPETNSWLTVKLPNPMNYVQMLDYVERLYPDWELVNGSIEDPRGSDDWDDYEDYHYYLAADIEEIDDFFVDGDDFTSGFEEL